MDNPNQAPNNLPVEPADLSYQVMPKQDGNQQPVVSAPPLPTKLSAPPARKFVYIIIAILILAILGIAAYFTLGSKKSSTPPAQVSSTKLPKIWLQKYFNKEICDDQTVCGDEANPDNDGLSNYNEFRAGTDPLNFDTDSDGLSDGDEVNVYQTEPTNPYTDTRSIVQQNQWNDGYQIKNGYNPLTPGLKSTDLRKQQIADDTAKSGLHEPTLTTLSQTTTHYVMIENFAYVQSSINVKKGDTVIWTNKDSAGHTVSGDNGGPASPTLNTNETYSYTFISAGTFAYHCTIHASMKGTVVVQ